MKSSTISTALTLVILLAGTVYSPAQAQTPAKTAATQKKFASPQDAADAVVKATQNNDIPALVEIFGPNSMDLAASADPVRQKNNAAAFFAMAQQKKTVTVDPKNKNRAILSVGNNDWPLPIPIVKKNGSWYFDTEAGRKEILFRRIGENELDALQICRGYVEAQKDYASEIHDGSGIHQYARKVISTPGKQDGLYWQNTDGTPGGPVSEMIAKAIAAGYTPGSGTGYHGYYFRVLQGQGPAAPLGQMDYVIGDAMIGGFALIAFPVEYRVSGVKTFIVSHDGIVYEKDLGPDTLKIAQGIDRYNPDKTWHRTDDEWPADAN
jgi:hypothetical protein